MMCKHVQATALLLFACFLMTQTVYAEPSPSIRYLMNEPVTLFGYGLEKLEEQFRSRSVCNNIEEFDENSGCSVFVTYDLDNNKLVFKLGMWIENMKNPGDVKYIREFMGVVVNRIRNFIGVHPISGETHGFNLLEYFFKHRGFALKDWPKGLGDELYNISEIEITCLTYDKGINSSKSIKRLECKTKLLGTPDDLFCSEIKSR